MPLFGTVAPLPITATLLPGCGTPAGIAGAVPFGVVTPVPNTATLPAGATPTDTPDGTFGAAGTVLLGTVAPVPNAATPPVTVAAGAEVPKLPFETNGADGAVVAAALANGGATVLFGIETPVPKTATFAAGAAAVVTGVPAIVGDTPDGSAGLFEAAVPPLPADTSVPVAGTGLTDETLPGGNVGLPAGVTATFGAADEMKPVDEMPMGAKVSFAARSMMPSPLKSAATTFLLSALIREMSSAIGRLVRVTDCAWPSALMKDTVNKRRIGTRLIGIQLPPVRRQSCSMRTRMRTRLLTTRLVDER